ncbi:MAG: putative toxin-antitoxin system toxin component, PIN family [Chloroflexi bacterium]|nr:putative toxin-antitoxin system toxin component, PIN family [Chloroflexota bacterium]
MLKVVFDTVVFVRCLINPHGTWGRAIFQYAHRYRLFVSQPVVVEILEVLHRPELSRKFRSMQALDRTAVIKPLGQAETVDLAEIPSVARDAKDDKFLATAAAAGADYLVSEDGDLLVLREYRGVQIITTAELLRILEEGEDTARSANL